MSAAHILVVDDEPGMRRYLQTVLELESYRVSTACDGEEALSKLQRDQPDVVLHFFDADRLTGKDRAEIDFFLAETNAAAMRNYNRSVMEWVVDVRQSLVRTR